VAFNSRIYPHGRRRHLYIYVYTHTHTHTHTTLTVCLLVRWRWRRLRTATTNWRCDSGLANTPRATACSPRCPPPTARTRVFQCNNPPRPVKQISITYEQCDAAATRSRPVVTRRQTETGERGGVYRRGETRVRGFFAHVGGGGRRGRVISLEIVVASSITIDLVLNPTATMTWSYRTVTHTPRARLFTRRRHETS